MTTHQKNINTSLRMRNSHYKAMSWQWIKALSKLSKKELLEYNRSTEEMIKFYNIKTT